MLHNDSPVTYRTIMRQNQIDLSKEDSWVLTSLLALPFTYDRRRDSLAHEILKIFAGHSILKKITRTAIVRRLGESNRLVVISSENSNGVENTMPEGYSCFVNEKGSLFHLQPGTIRYFEHAQRVVEHFKAHNRPPQRSIARISLANHGAGLCSGIYDVGRLVGFLFFNGPVSKEELDHEELSILLYQANTAVARVLSEERLSKTYYELQVLYPSDHVGARLDIDRLCKLSEALGSAAGGKTVSLSHQSTVTPGRYLMSHGNVAQMIGRTAARLFASGEAVLSISETAQFLIFDVTSHKPSDGKLNLSQRLEVQDIASDCRCLNLRFECASAASFRIQVLKDKASPDPNINYSVEVA